MKSRIFSALCALVLVAQLAISAVPPITVFHAQVQSEQQSLISDAQLRRMHNAEHWLIITAQANGAQGKWGCTGYAIGKHAILSAQHCDDPTITDIQLDDDAHVKVVGREFDGADHVIWLVSGVEFTDTIADEVNHAKAPQQGENVISWGNPTGVEDQFRRGYVAGVVPGVPTPAQQEGIQDSKVIPWLWVFDMAGNHGDSGSAIFDATDGHVVALVTFGLGSIAPTFMGGYALQFTHAQLKSAEHFRGANYGSPHWRISHRRQARPLPQDLLPRLRRDAQAPLQGW